MSYEVLTIIVVINAIATLSLWRLVASKSHRGPRLKKKAAAALWRSDPIVPKHDPPQAAGGDFSLMVRDGDRLFFADFMEFANVVNRWLANEFVASRFRLQDLPEGCVSLGVNHSDGPTFGRCFAIFFNQTRVGRLEISPRYNYTDALPEVRTNVEIDWARFLGFSALAGFLSTLAWYLTTGDPNNDDYKNAQMSINSALMMTLWENYRVSEFDEAVDRTDEWGEFSLGFGGTASCYMQRRSRG
ncbi:hypothetical protein ACVWXP_002068 [Bradyrhizobium sp. USDA 4463]